MHFLAQMDHRERLKRLAHLTDTFSARAEKLDPRGEFPMDNIEDLKSIGYTVLTVPLEYGGSGISLYELVQLQEQIAIGDGSTALSIGWHMGILKGLSDDNKWTGDTFQWLCSKVINGALINSAVTERATGSPTRGGIPQTTAVKQGSKWIINGRKTFTTLAPALDYAIVSAYVPDCDRVGNFVVPCTEEGVRINETWNSLSMRGTGSHDLVLDHVSVGEEAFVEWTKPGSKKASGWLLHIPACYLGIAQAAQNYAICFAKQYKPNSMKGAIIEVPTVQYKIGQTELELMKSRQLLHAAARQWDEATQEERAKLAPLLGATKMIVTNAAMEIVDIAMRVVGASSLSMAGPLQRYYRDVRAGLHNPPMDDMTVNLLAQHAIDRSQ